MKTIAIPLCAGVALVFSSWNLIAQDSQGDESTPPQSQTSDFRTFQPTEPEWERFRSTGEITQQGGEAVYDAVCAGCHMPDGEGAVGAGAYPALAGNELLADPSYPIYLVLEGQKAMPPFGGMLDDQQVADVVNYIRSHFGNAFLDEYGEATAQAVGETRP
ncbi:MAG: cytochrome c [Rhodobacterales bacterium]|nr:cytochrome c [Rhodobacterales bacterium]